MTGVFLAVCAVCGDTVPASEAHQPHEPDCKRPFWAVGDDLEEACWCKATTCAACCWECEANGV